MFLGNQKDYHFGTWTVVRMNQIKFSTIIRSVKWGSARLVPQDII